jgi:hypothetical protein
MLSSFSWIFREVAEEQGWAGIILPEGPARFPSRCMTQTGPAPLKHRAHSHQGGSVRAVAGDLLTGKVHNLRKDVQMGAITGPVFEAEIETERGSGVVRFLLTRQGLELMQPQPEQPPVPPAPPVPQLALQPRGGAATATARSTAARRGR